MPGYLEDLAEDLVRDICCVARLVDDLSELQLQDVDQLLFANLLHKNDFV